MLLATLLLSFQLPIQPTPILPVDQTFTVPVQLPSGGTGMETFRLQSYRGNIKRPLLIAFHGFSISQNGPFNKSILEDKAQEYGWHFLSPLGREQHDHGTPDAQAHVDAAVKWVLNNRAVNRQRIYVIGFSAGGGFATSFTALHQNPDDYRIAALVNHSGTLSQRERYGRGVTMGMDCANPFRLQAYRFSVGTQYEELNCFCQFFPQGNCTTGIEWGGAPGFEYDPNYAPYEYIRASSVLFLDQGTANGFIKDPMRDLSPNLFSTPTQTFYHEDDPNTAERQMCEAFGLYMDAMNPRHTTNVLTAPLAPHKWSSLPFDSLFAWMAPLRLDFPDPDVPHNVLTDRDAKHLYFDITRNAPSGLSNLRWTLEPAQNRIRFAYGSGDRASVNVQSLVFDWELAGLTADNLSVDLNDEVVVGELGSVILSNYSQPSLVNIVGPGTHSWTEYAAMNGLGDLTLTRTARNAVSFNIQL